MLYLFPPSWWSIKGMQQYTFDQASNPQSAFPLNANFASKAKEVFVVNYNIVWKQKSLWETSMFMFKSA